MLTGIMGMGVAVVQVIVVDASEHQITFHDQKSGKMLRRVGGRTEKGAYILTDPQHVCSSEAGLTMVTDWAAPNLRVFNSALQPVRDFVTYGSGEGRMLKPSGATCDAHGYFFVADSHNHRVHVMGPDGRFVRMLLTEHDGLNQPLAVAAFATGKLAVTEARGLVKIFKYM